VNAKNQAGLVDLVSGAAETQEVNDLEDVWQQQQEQLGVTQSGVVGALRSGLDVGVGAGVGIGVGADANDVGIEADEMADVDDDYDVDDDVGVGVGVDVGFTYNQQLSSGGYSRGYNHSHQQHYSSARAKAQSQWREQQQQVQQQLRPRPRSSNTYVREQQQRRQKQERDQRREQVSATFDTKHIVGERFSSGSSYAATERERRSNEDADIIQSPTDRLHKAVTMSLMAKLESSKRLVEETRRKKHSGHGRIMAEEENRKYFM